jgi:hypothetical protein
MKLSSQQKKWAIISGVAVGVVAFINLPPVRDWLESSEVGGTIGGFVLLALLAGGYFLPTIIATLRNHRNAGAIVAVNVLLGWTFIGWVVALVWSMTNPPEPVVVNTQAPPPMHFQVGDVVNGHRYNGQTWEPIQPPDTTNSPGA